MVNARCREPAKKRTSGTMAFEFDLSIDQAAEQGSAYG
jgi:hypothetical protein